MKKTLFATIAFLAVMAISCQNTGNGNNEQPLKENEELIRQRVEQMMQMNADNDADKLLTADMFALQTKAQSVHFCADICFGFQWDLGVFDVCSQKPEVLIEGIKPIDSLHCDVAMRYVDSSCYNYPYTLKLLKENGEWRIDDVVYKEGNTLREDCKSFYEYMLETYRTTNPKEIMEYMVQEEPMEENYTDPATIFYNNPDAIRDLIEEIKNCHELFKQNPGYTEEYGKQIEAMIERIASHL